MKKGKFVVLIGFLSLMLSVVSCKKKLDDEIIEQHIDLKKKGKFKYPSKIIYEIHTLWGDDKKELLFDKSTFKIHLKQFRSKDTMLSCSFKKLDFKKTSDLNKLMHKAENLDELKRRIFECSIYKMIHKEDSTLARFLENEIVSHSQKNRFEIHVYPKDNNFRKLIVLASGEENPACMTKKRRYCCF